MYVIDIVRHKRKIAPRDGQLLVVKLLDDRGWMVGQMVRRVHETWGGHVVRIFDVIVDSVDDVTTLDADVFSEENVLIPPMRVMPHCFGERGTGRAIFSSVKRNLGAPELGPTNMLTRDVMYVPGPRLFVPQEKYDVEPVCDPFDRSTWPIKTWVGGVAAAVTPLEERDRLLIPHTVLSATSVDLFIARAFAYREGRELPILECKVDDD